MNLKFMKAGTEDMFPPVEAAVESAAERTIKDI